MKRVIPPIVRSLRAEREKPAIGADRGSVRPGRLEGESDPRNRVRKPKSEPLIGLAARRESSKVCVSGGLTIGYEAHGIERQIRETLTGIEGSGDAWRRRVKGTLAQLVRDRAAPQNSSLPADRGRRLSNAGECSGRAQACCPPPPTGRRQILARMRCGQHAQCGNVRREISSRVGTPFTWVRL